MVDTRTPFLIVVHPGSACGSANFNIGRSLAEAARDLMAHTFATWTGGVAVIHGALSDELTDGRFDAFNAALKGLLKRTDGAVEIRGCDEEDFNQVAAARAIIADLRLTPAAHKISLTGAWFDPDGDSGCVNSVQDVFVQAGFAAEVLDCAVCLDEAERANVLETEEDEEEMA